MLLRCLNPDCGAPFRYSNEGRIFTIERAVAVPGTAEPKRLIEDYWLCGLCSKRLKVVVENGCVTTRPMHQEPVAGEAVDDRVPVA